jgi:hypothetical protein
LFSDNTALKTIYERITTAAAKKSLYSKVTARKAGQKKVKEEEK